MKGKPTIDPSQGEISLLLADLREGRRDSVTRLLKLVYNELRRLAAAYMQRERPDHTLQATALVHEAYLKLFKEEPISWESRHHFFCSAAQVMRRILVDHARSHQSDKHGGGQQKLSLDEALIAFGEQDRSLLALDDALTRLAELNARQSRIVELRYFAGLTVEETAELLRVAPKTVKRDWSVARAWLHRELRRGVSP